MQYAHEMQIIYYGIGIVSIEYWYGSNSLKPDASNETRLDLFALA